MSHAVPLVPVSHGAGHVGQMGQYRVIGRPGLYGVCVSDGGARSLVHHPPVGLLISLPESRTGVDIPRGAGAGVPDYSRYCHAPEPEGRAA